MAITTYAYKSIPGPGPFSVSDPYGTRHNFSRLIDAETFVLARAAEGDSYWALRDDEGNFIVVVHPDKQ